MAFSIGDKVRLTETLSYLKTADPMPMLRPPDLISPGEQGEVVALHPAETLAVRFRRGTFLLAPSALSSVQDEAEQD
ncbi:MAG: NAD(P)H dehydrogenase assembly family protein [Synechococcus sp.]